MTDILEKAIRENKELFEDDAIDGHFERFEAKLNKEFGHRRKFNRKLYLRIAVSIVFVSLLGNQLRIYLAPDKAPVSNLASVSPQYSEVEFYFTSAINQSMSEWEQLNKEGYISEDDQKMIKQEMADFDQLHLQLQNELKATPDDERVINAMLEYYQARLNVITLVINKLNNVKQQKLTNNETEI